MFFCSSVFWENWQYFPFERWGSDVKGGIVGWLDRGLFVDKSLVIIIPRSCICICIGQQTLSYSFPDVWKSHCCTCLTFLHCAFSSGSLDCLHQKSIATLAAFVLLFSTVGFQMFPQIACMRGCIVTWLHLFAFSPLCVFKCILKLFAREEA